MTLSPEKQEAHINIHERNKIAQIKIYDSSVEHIL